MRALAVLGLPIGRETGFSEILYIQAVRSRPDYGVPYLMTVSSVALQPLETAQNATFRVLLRVPQWTKCVCFRVEAHINSIAKRVSQLSVGHLAALLRHGGSEQLPASVG